MEPLVVVADGVGLGEGGLDGGVTVGLGRGELADGVGVALGAVPLEPPGVGVLALAGLPVLAPGLLDTPEPDLAFVPPRPAGLVLVRGLPLGLATGLLWPGVADGARAEVDADVAAVVAE